ncbi:MAG: hypothetical protein IJE07_09970 [Clostridia bacterium]|nr:hypothetical protein [Clostridia bacterium]
MELKKNYRGFVWWLLGYLAGLMLCCFLPVEDGGLLMRVIFVFTAADMALLAFIVWKTEAVYWYNGTEYEDAVKAGSERRKAFAWRHFRVFGWYALAQIVFCCVMQLIGAAFWIDIIVFCVGLCAAAFSTMLFKL